MIIWQPRPTLAELKADLNKTLIQMTIGLAGLPVAWPGSGRRDTQILGKRLMADEPIPELCAV